MLELYLKTKLAETIAASMFDPAAKRRYHMSKNQKLQRQPRSTRGLGIARANPTDDVNEASIETLKQKQWQLYIRVAAYIVLFIIPLIIALGVGIPSSNGLSSIIEFDQSSDPKCINCLLSSNGLLIGLGLVFYEMIIGLFLYYIVKDIPDLFGIIPEIRLTLFFSLIFAVPAFSIAISKTRAYNGVINYFLVNAAVLSAMVVILPYQVLLARREGEHIDMVPTDFLSILILYARSLLINGESLQVTRRKSKENRPEIEMTLLLQDPSGVKLFEKHLIAEFCVELLKFHMQVQALKARWDGMDDGNRQDWAFDIFERFIADGSPMQVNIDDETRTRICNIFFPSDNASQPTNVQSPRIAAIESSPKRGDASPIDRTRSMSAESTELPNVPRSRKVKSTVFDVADTEVCHLLRVGPFERFSRTSTYKEWLTRKNAPVATTISTAFGSLRTMSANIINSIGTPTKKMTKRVSGRIRAASQGLISTLSSNRLSTSPSLETPGSPSPNHRTQNEIIHRAPSIDEAMPSDDTTNPKFRIDDINETDDDVAVEIKDVNDNNLI